MIFKIISIVWEMKELFLSQHCLSPCDMSPRWHVPLSLVIQISQWTTLLESWRTNSLLNVILMIRLNNNMSIWYRSSRYLSIKLMANTLGRLSLLNSFKSPGTFSETLDLDQKLQIILILQRQQYWHKHFPWFEHWFHCFTSPYWSGLLVFVF